MKIKYKIVSYNINPIGGSDSVTNNENKDIFFLTILGENNVECLNNLYRTLEELSIVSKKVYVVRDQELQ